MEYGKISNWSLLENINIRVKIFSKIFIHRMECIKYVVAIVNFSHISLRYGWMWLSSPRFRAVSDFLYSQHYTRASMFKALLLDYYCNKFNADCVQTGRGILDTNTIILSNLNKIVATLSICECCNVIGQCP
jgi:hypothetical protein